MAGTVIHRGAVPERLPTEGQETCGKLCPPVFSAKVGAMPLTCVYVAGHEGLHYCKGEIWGDVRGQRD